MPLKLPTSNKMLIVAGAALALGGVAGCSKSGSSDQSASTQTSAANVAVPTETAATTNVSESAATGAPVAAAAPAADNTDTVAGVKFASYTGDAAAGEKAFVVCKTCHVTDAGVNRIGPSLHGIVGRHSGIEPGFIYSAANKNSGITWSQEKLFQYLEHPQRVVPGTKMTYTGIADPQKRADVIAYLKTQS